MIEPVLIGEAAGIRSATAAGLVLGAQVPIILSSRADPPEARMAAVAQAMMV